MIYNCHVHSEQSHDCSTSVNDMCDAAIQKGITGIAITNHCDCEFSERDQVFTRILSSVEDANEAAHFYKNRLEVLNGVELGDVLFNSSFAKKILTSFSFDIVLLSVHAVLGAQNEQPFSGIDFSTWSHRKLYDYLEAYFTQMEKCINYFDFDVLSHLTVPIRYINCKYRKNIDLHIFNEQIKRILQTIIQQDKALELNTQSAQAQNAFFLPDEEILEQYLHLGGKKIVLGSDAHSAAQINTGLDAGKKLLIDRGVFFAYYYKDRKPISYAL